MVGLFAALVPAAILVARHGSGARKMGVPLVPFLSAGAVLGLFAGDWILSSYVALF
jgi:prepilin signal peptidase PulO-like enzyme (type II secretory pathway)